MAQERRQIYHRAPEMGRNQLELEQDSTLCIVGRSGGNKNVEEYGQDNRNPEGTDGPSVW